MLVMACGPTVRPDGIAADPDPVAPLVPTTTVGTGGAGHPVVVGEMCPEAAAGRPGIAPLWIRGFQWSDNADELGEPIERNAVGKFTVLGYDGARAGVFESLGAADAGLPQDVATGSYLGSSPCTHDGGSGARTEDLECNKAMHGCGLAIADIGQGGDPAPTIEIGGACMAGDQIVVDIDGDGRNEAFPIAAFLDNSRAPADEVTATSLAQAACTPRFSIYGLKLAPGVEPGDPVDPRYQVVVDILAVADLDGDGRRELVVALHYPDSRSIVLYAAPQLASRLEQSGESVSWPAPAAATTPTTPATTTKTPATTTTPAPAPAPAPAKK